MLLLPDLEKLAAENNLLGLFKDVDNDAYHAGPGVSSSILREAKKTNAHMKAAMDAPHEPTDPMAFGTAVHVAILEPDLFFKSYGTLPENASDLRTKVGKDAFAELKAQGLTPLKFKDFERIKRISETVWKSKTAQRLLSGPGANELSGYWIDQRTGIHCKMRTDRYNRDLGVLVDVKTCDSAQFYPYRKKAWDLGYHQQGAYHLDGYNEALEIERRRLSENPPVIDGRVPSWEELMRGLEFQGADTFVHMAVETEEPYGVAFRFIGPRSMELGRHEMREYLDRFAECKKTGIWTAYSEEIEELELPGLAFANFSPKFDVVEEAI